MNEIYDVFISYKESDGKDYARRLKKELSEKGYSAYFNENEKREGDFTGRLERAIVSCTDFVLVLTENVINSILNKDCVENNEEDYVNWEIAKACEYKKHILLLRADGSCFAASPEYRYERMRNLVINPDDGNGGSQLHKAETFGFDTIYENLKADIEERMILRRVICSVVDTKKKIRNESGVYKDKHCVFNLQTLAALCGYITGDGRLATELESFENVQKANEYIAENNNGILHSFLDYFELEAAGKDGKAINIVAKNSEMQKRFVMKPEVVLRYLYETYKSKGATFHNQFDMPVKQYLNKTISDYILGLAWNGYFIRNNSARDLLIDDILPTFIKTHNHSQEYIYALTEKGRFEGETQWLFCDINNPKDEKYSLRVMEFIGEFYNELHLTAMSRTHFVASLWNWLGDDKTKICSFCKKLITVYNCCDAKIWNEFAGRDVYSISVLRNMFSDYVVGSKKELAIKMIEQGLSSGIYYSDDMKANERLLKLLCDTLNIIMENSGVSENGKVAPKYRELCQGTAIAFYTFWEKESFKAQVEEYVRRAYEQHKIMSFHVLYNQITGADKSVGEVRSIEAEIEDFLEKTDEGILQNKHFITLFKKLKLNEKYKELYNRALARMLELSFRYDFFGLDALVFVNYNSELCSRENREKLFELIRRFVRDFTPKAELEDRQYGRIFGILKNPEFGSGQSFEFKLKMFYDTRVDGETKIGFCNLWIDKEMKERLFKDIIGGDASSCGGLIHLLTLKNLGWKRANIFPIVELLIDFEAFIKLDAEVQNALIHHVKTAPEYRLLVARLVADIQNNLSAWDKLNCKVKTAISMHIRDFVDDFERFRYICEFLEEIIEDIASMRNSRSGIHFKYGIKEETLIYHMINLFRNKPWKTAKLCAAAQIKWYGQLRKEEEWGYDEREMLKRREGLFRLVLSNPCIRELTWYLARANYPIFVKNFRTVGIDDETKQNCLSMLEGVIRKTGDFFWFGKKIEIPETANLASGVGKLQKINGVDFGSVSDEFSKYAAYSEDSFEFQDRVLNEAKINSVISAEEGAVDFEEDVEKILLWKNSESESVMYALTKKKLFARWRQQSELYKDLRFNALLFIPQMCEEIQFEEKASEDINVKKAFEEVAGMIESELGGKLLADNGGRYSYDRFVPGSGVDGGTWRSVNDFFFAYRSYTEMSKKRPEICGAFLQYITGTKKFFERKFKENS